MHHDVTLRISEYESRRAICRPPYFVLFVFTEMREESRRRAQVQCSLIFDGGNRIFRRARNQTWRMQKAWLWMQRARLVGNSRIPRHPDVLVRFPILRQPRLALHLVTLYHGRRIPPDDSRKLCWETSCLRNEHRRLAFSLFLFTGNRTSEDGAAFPPSLASQYYDGRDEMQRATR